MTGCDAKIVAKLRRRVRQWSVIRAWTKRSLLDNKMQTILRAQCLTSSQFSIYRRSRTNVASNPWSRLRIFGAKRSLAPTCPPQCLLLRLISGFSDDKDWVRPSNWCNWIVSFYLLRFVLHSIKSGWCKSVMKSPQIELLESADRNAMCHQISMTLSPPPSVLLLIVCRTSVRLTRLKKECWNEAAE